MKINYKFGLNTPVEDTVLTKDDILTTMKYLVELNNGKGRVDDIDHLGNRRVRAVGELHWRTNLELDLFVWKELSKKEWQFKKLKR